MITGTQHPWLASFVPAKICFFLTHFIFYFFFFMMTLSFYTDVVVSTLAPDGADPAASAAASIGSSLRQQSSQSAHSSHSAHSSRSRARSRAGSSSSRSRARSTIEEEVTAEQRMGKAIGLAALLGSVAVRDIFVDFLQ